jgi:hypothetical protein
MGETRNLMAKDLENWSLGTLQMELDDNIKINIQKIDCDGKWIELVHNHVRWKALLSVVLNLLTETGS